MVSTDGHYETTGPVGNNEIHIKIASTTLKYTATHLLMSPGLVQYHNYCNVQ